MVTPICRRLQISLLVSLPQSEIRSSRGFATLQRFGPAGVPRRLEGSAGGAAFGGGAFRMTTLEPGEILRATLPPGYALTMYAVLHELGAAQCVVNKPVLLNDEEEREIREWVDGDSLGVPGGWFPPDDWRLRALRKVHKFQNAFTGETLSAIMQNLCRADVPEDVDMRWRADKEEGGSAGGGEPSHEPEPAPAPAPRKPLYYKEGPNETPWDSLGGPPIDPQCEYKDMVEWLSSGTATIDGHLVGPHKTSKASGDKAQDKRVNAECRSILHKRCGKTWLIQSKNNEAWHCRGRRPDDSWDGSIHAGTAIKSEEAKSAEMLTALISLLDSKKSQHARETYQDRGGAHFMTTYSDDQALKLAKAGLFKDVDTPQMLRAGRWSVWCLV